MVMAIVLNNFGLSTILKVTLTTSTFDSPTDINMLYYNFIKIA